jgi:flagellar basal body P-ring protein FlgI
MATQLAEPTKPASPDATSEVVIETRNLTKVYRDFWGRQKVRALNALQVTPRDIVAIIQAIKQAGDAYQRTRLTPFVKKLLSRWLAWTR